MTLNRLFRPVLLLTLLLAFAAQGAIPAGMMPGHSAGTFKLIICSASGTHTISVPVDRFDPHPPAKTPPCPYAFAALLSLPPAAAPVIVPRVFSALPVAPPLTAIVPAQRVFGNASPRAPPVLS